MSDLTLLPPSSSLLARAIEKTTMERKARLETPIRSLWDVDTCPVDILPWLAWAFSVEVWDHAWPEKVKREVIANSVRVHRLKGTKGSVSDALASLGMDAEISEWFEYGGDPHTFKIDVLVDQLFAAGFRMDHALVQMVGQVIKNVKPVRSRYEIRLGRPVNINIQNKTLSSGARMSRASVQPVPRTHQTTDATAARSSGQAKSVNRRSFIPSAPPHAGSASTQVLRHSNAIRLSRVAYQLQIGSA